MKKLEEIRTRKPDLMKKYNDSLSVLKKMIAEELYSGHNDTLRVGESARAVGELQSRIEVLRYQHFSDLLALCTPEQKEKLKPILLEVFGRKPPKEDIQENRQGRRSAPERRREGEMRDSKPMPPREPRDERRAPPDINEKITRYTERLSLTGEQQEQVKSILNESRKEGEKLRMIKDPDPEMIENEKEKIKRGEDEAILKILNTDQKAEFEKMIRKRKSR